MAMDGTGVIGKRAMELTFEEYCDADLSLIRDYYETTFSHYVPDLAERIFVVRDAHWLVGPCACATNRITTTCAVFVCCPTTSRWGWARACCSTPATICRTNLWCVRPCRLKSRSTSRPASPTCPCMNWRGRSSLYDQQREQGYQIELLVRQAKAPVYN